MTKRNIFLAAAFVLVFGGSVFSKSGGQRLADFQRVVLSDTANKVQQAAADELLHYVGRISGRTLAKVRLSDYKADAPGLSFFVGDDPARKVLGENPAPWKDDEWMLRTVPKGLVVAGRDEDGNPWSIDVPAGSMLAAYTLLDDYLGVRWFWPGPFGEHVPTLPEATLPELNVRRAPAFSIRSVSIGNSGYYLREFADATRRWQRRSRLGWTRSASFGHSWEQTFEQREGKTFREHPEWFALVKGKRRPPQMCTTNPEVIARVVQRAVDSPLDIVNISPSDGGGFCECDNCTKLDVPGVLSYDNKTVQLSDRIFTYANEVARRVREKAPTKKVGLHAYTYYNRPPRNIKALEPNLYLSLVYQSSAHRDPENLREWRENVAGWEKLGAKMVVREGWGNHYTLDLPYLHYSQILTNLAEARRLGFTGAYGDGTKCFATQAPNYWAIVRMMWDPDRDPTQVMPDFYASAYGPCTAAMQAYFETFTRALDENWAKRDRNVDTTGMAYANMIGAWRRLLPVEVIAKADEHLKEAERLAPAGEYADRIRFHRFGQTYTATMLDLLETYRQLAELGVKLDYFSSVVKTRRDDPKARETLLRRAYDLGEERESLLLVHRDWAGPYEGLYAFSNDKGLRLWHDEVKKELGINRPSAVTKETLNPK